MFSACSGESDRYIGIGCQVGSSAHSSSCCFGSTPTCETLAGRWSHQAGGRHVQRIKVESRCAYGGRGYSGGGRVHVSTAGSDLAERWI